MWVCKYPRPDQRLSSFVAVMYLVLCFMRQLAPTQQTSARRIFLGDWVRLPTAFPNLLARLFAGAPLKGKTGSWPTQTQAASADQRPLSA